MSLWRRLVSICPRSSLPVRTYTTTDAITIAAATAPAASSTIRRRKLIAMMTSSRIPLPDRVHQAGPSACLGLAPQIADVHLQRVRRRPEVIAPHALEDLRAREDLIWVAHEQFQQQKLSACEFERPPVTARFVREQIELDPEAQGRSSPSQPVRRSSARSLATSSSLANGLTR